MPTQTTPSGSTSFDSVIPALRSALQARDPWLAAMILRLFTDPVEEPKQPLPENCYTFDKFLEELRSVEFRKKSLEDKRIFRQQRLQQLESAEGPEAMPDRYRIGDLLLEIWNDGSLYSRKVLLELIASLPLVYGPWKALKKIYKQAEERRDWEIFGALVARFDEARDSGNHQISHRTLSYLCRRAWRTLRRIGQSLPGCFPDVACDVLCQYTTDYSSARALMKSWVFNQILFRQTGEYRGTGFLFGRYVTGRGRIARPTSLLKYRAFAEAWKRSPRPLFSLLERARCEAVREYATLALKMDFRSSLRDVQPAWVARLVAVGSGSIDEFVVWLLNNVPKFEQSKFRELGLHESAQRLCFSESAEAAKFGADYCRAHARDLSATDLIRFFQSKHTIVHNLAIDLLKALNPRTEVGLQCWGQMLEIGPAIEFATSSLRKHFSSAELTPQWFADRLVADMTSTRKFAIEELPKLHPVKKLGKGYFMSVIDRLDMPFHRHTAQFACEQLENLGLDDLSSEDLQQLLMQPFSRDSVIRWVANGKVKAQRLTADFLKQIAYHPTFDGNAIVKQLNLHPRRAKLEFNPELSFVVLSWLGDVRVFSPSEIGFAWLMELVQRSERNYHDFAVKTMSKAFLPADFAPAQSAESSQSTTASKDEINVDLGGASFVFTGKLNTMTRDEAQDKVTKAGGANSGSVSKTLDYLVIGDDGSPLYGQGRKGSKQLKAEQLIEQGSKMKIISETAFLQMLAGEKREFSEDSVAAGCEQLWRMMVDAAKQDDPLARFARVYIRHHHPDICLKETDRPVDPGAEIPTTFLTFDRVRPLFSDQRSELRSLALELAQYEFARWQPPMEGLVELCESSDPAVRNFVSLALTCDDLPEHKRYRLDASILTPVAVYAFCESRDIGTRQLGMKLISLHPRLRLPEELFRLTESPDGTVRGFVIRQFWGLYRQRDIMSSWQPHYQAAKSSVGTQKKPLSEEAIREKIGSGPPAKPEQLPARPDEMEYLLRRVLFELPPGRPVKSRDDQGSGESESNAAASAKSKQAKNSPSDAVSKGDDEKVVVKKLRPLPARQAKLNWVETIRDLAIEDAEFASLVSPVLCEFMRSHGKSEQAASLVAITRIRAAHGEEVIRDRVAMGQSSERSATGSVAS